MINTTDNKNTHNGHAFVDLGLPSGLLWATCNVGASSPEQTGLYFAWGETKGYTAEQVRNGERMFGWKSHKIQCYSSALAPEQDAAHSYLGGKWRMPTKKEWQELMDNCDSLWTENYNGTGVSGIILTSKTNGNSIFLRAAGICFGKSMGSIDSVGYYWSASWYKSSGAKMMSFYLGDINTVFSTYAFHGCSARAVCERQTKT